MNVLRTPEQRFTNLPDYPFSPNYAMVETDLRMHYVDEGKGPTVLLLHGEPSWSFLYRKMIPHFVEAGYRAIAPDLIGFGRSDKPTAVEDYTYVRHLTWLKALIDQLELTDIHLFCQDWGGLLGLRLAAENSKLFATITAANTFLPKSGMKANDAFLQWREYSQATPEFKTSKILQSATATPLSEEVLAGYDAPFPDESYKAGARAFPLLVPFDDTDHHDILPACDAAWSQLVQWEKPFLTLFSDSDPIMSGLEKVFQHTVPGAKDQPHDIIKNGGHFLQEDQGEEIADKMIGFLKGL